MTITTSSTTTSAGHAGDHNKHIATAPADNSPSPRSRALSSTDSYAGRKPEILTILREPILERRAFLVQDNKEKEVGAPG